MKKLIKLQLRNVFHQKLFYVCLGLILLLTPIISLISSFFFKDLGDFRVLPQIMNFLSSKISIVGIIFIILFSCLEFSEGTAKNIIARGYTRKQLLFSTYIVAIIGLFTMYIITSLVIFVLFAKNGIGYDSTMIYVLINSIVSIICYTIFYSTLAVIIRKSGISIVVCLLMPLIISPILMFVDSSLNINISEFWLDNVSNNFNNNPTLSNLYYPIVAYIIYSLIFIFIGNMVLNKKEIK